MHVRIMCAVMLSILSTRLLPSYGVLGLGSAWVIKCLPVWLGRTIEAYTTVLVVFHTRHCAVIYRAT
jgi:hypothetical protein